MRMKAIGAVCVMLAIFRFAANGQHVGTVTRVPFVGCRSDGQMGPLKAPSGKSMILPIAPAVAGRLAYYKTRDGEGILAPRGWYCFGTYGSNGANLYVSPNKLGADELLLGKGWRGFTGPAVQLSYSIGDTSGRFDVARMIARIFPSRHAFVQQVIEEGIEPASAFPTGPYRDDELTRKNNKMVEYLTPSEKVGLGTHSKLRENGDPIHGVVILVGETPDLEYLAVRLPESMADLAPVILQEVERSIARNDDKN